MLTPLPDADPSREQADSPSENGPAERTFASPYPVSRLAPPFDLVETAREIARADALLAMQTEGRLRLIASQIDALRRQAEDILAKAREDALLHRAECRFSRRPGQVCHLYLRPDGRSYFSLLAPADWQGQPPHLHLGGWRLENDMSFTRIAQPAGTLRTADEA